MPNQQPQPHKESDIVRFISELALLEEPEEGSRSIPMRFYTGAKVERYDWSRGEKYFLRLSIKKGECQIAKLKNAPLLDSHMDYSVRNVFGVIDDPILDDAGCKAIATFSDDSESEIIFRRVKNKTLRNLSVGAVILHLMLESKDGETPSYLADKWYPREVSIVPLGADPDAHFLSDQLPIARLMDQAADLSREAPPTQKENLMPETIASPAATQTTPPADPNPAAPLAATTPPATTPPAVDLATIAKDAAELAVKNERERFAGIQSAAKAAKLPVEFSDQLINSGVSLADARVKIIDEMARLSDLAATNAHHSTAGATADPMAKLEADAVALASSDRTKSKEQHFAALLRANPKAYNDSVVTV